MTKEYWKDGIMGVVTGDALGCPVQFRSREEIACDPVTKMTGYGTYNMPPGTWTDDSSMTLATLAGIAEKGTIDLEDIMTRFALWLEKGEYTPYGEAFDNGRTTTMSIMRFLRDADVEECGGRAAGDNGNGSLMRILPACLFACDGVKEGKMTDEEAVSLIHKVSGLTHNHLRSKIACGLYFFLIRGILDSDGEPAARLQKGLDEGFAFYGQYLDCLTELSYYGRLRDLYAFRDLPASEIRSSGYVVDTLEAAVWSLLQAGTFRSALITAVNLGEDTDTVGAVCGGLAGLIYGIEDIPEEWLAAIPRKEWIESLCDEVIHENG